MDAAKGTTEGKLRNTNEESGHDKKDGGSEASSKFYVKGTPGDALRH